MQKVLIPSLPTPIVSVEWLAANLYQTNLIILDASLQPVGSNSSPDLANELQIPGTQIFDFDKKICDPVSPLPHMMPKAPHFQREVQALGVRTDSLVVVYDRLGIYSSPRAWWMFKAMGHHQVSVLDGGFPAWLKANVPCEPKKQVLVQTGDFASHPCPEMFCDADQVLAAIHDETFSIMDARSEARYLGREAEPRKGLRSGHIPGSHNVPFGTVLHRGYLRTQKELQSIFSRKANPNQKLIFTCGSGVTSCILALAATVAGYQKLCVYDGSWSEWGLPSSRPIATGCDPSSPSP